MQTDTIPDTFTVTITEEDRAVANEFLSCDNCIIASAVRRTLQTDTPFGVGTNRMVLLDKSGIKFKVEPFAGQATLCVNKNAQRPPFYGSAVVGKTFTFTQI